MRNFAKKKCVYISVVIAAIYWTRKVLSIRNHKVLYIYSKISQNLIQKVKAVFKRISMKHFQEWF